MNAGVESHLKGTGSVLPRAEGLQRLQLRVDGGLGGRRGLQRQLHAAQRPRQRKVRAADHHARRRPLCSGEQVLASQLWTISTQSCLSRTIQIDSVSKASRRPCISLVLQRQGSLMHDDSTPKGGGCQPRRVGEASSPATTMHCLPRGTPASSSTAASAWPTVTLSSSSSFPWGRCAAGREQLQISQRQQQLSLLPAAASLLRACWCAFPAVAHGSRPLLLRMEFYFDVGSGPHLQQGAEHTKLARADRQGWVGTRGMVGGSPARARY